MVARRTRDTRGERGGEPIAASDAHMGETGFHDPEELEVVEKPWGREVLWARHAQYCAKRIEVRAGEALSLQVHRHKHETLCLVAGVVRLRLGDTVRTLQPGCVAVVPPGTVHRIEAFTDAVVFEVSTPELDDVVRLEDRYGRATAARPQPDAGQ